MARRSFSGHRDDDCEGRIFQRIDVAGEVTITPKVECGPVSVTCLEGRIIPGGLFDSKFRRCESERRCRVLFVQELLVEVPVEVEVETECSLIGVRCGVPSLNPSACLPEHSGTSDCSGSSGGSSGTSGSCSDDSSSSQDRSGESGSQP